jgi:hypothetical protein
MRRITVFIKFVFLSVSMVATFASAQTFRLNSDGYFNAGGTDVMAFSDFYPEGHQGGVCVIMNGHRIATNGDIRLEATPGQWHRPHPPGLPRTIGISFPLAADRIRPRRRFFPLYVPGIGSQL